MLDRLSACLISTNCMISVSCMTLNACMIPNACMPYRYRPVDCETGAPVMQFMPGLINNTYIYSNEGSTAGWGWMPHSYDSAFWNVQGEAASPHACAMAAT